MQKILYCKNGKKKIFGRAYIPSDGTAPYPTVIYSHGYGYNMQPYPMEWLAERGIAAYSFDFCGGSAMGRSDGKSCDMSVMTEAEDLNAVIETLIQEEWVDSNNLFLCGMSQGGYVSSIVAAKRQDEIRGLILLCPAYVLQYEFKEQFREKSKIPKTFQFSNMTLGRRYVEDIWDFDVYDVMKAYQKDVLIFHGDADGMVPLKYSQRAVDVFPAAELVVLHGANHMLFLDYADRIFGMTVDYVLSHRHRTLPVKEKEVQ